MLFLWFKTALTQARPPGGLAGQMRIVLGAQIQHAAAAWNQLPVALRELRAEGIVHVVSGGCIHLGGASPNINGISWELCGDFMGFHGILWDFMGFHGILW